MEGIEVKGSHKSFIKQRHRCFNLFTSKREEIDCSFVQHPCFHTIVTQCFFLFSQISFIYLGFYHLSAFCLLVFLLFREKTKFNDASKRNRRNILNIFFFLIDFSLLLFPSFSTKSLTDWVRKILHISLLILLTFLFYNFAAHWDVKKEYSLWISTYVREGDKKVFLCI
jgi:hypothetical protein